MKRNFSFTSRIITAFTLCAASISAGILASTTIKEERAEATSSSYWTSWISSNTSALTTGGTALVTALNSKITSTMSSQSYKSLWTAYETSDLVPGSTNLIWDMYGGFQFTYSSKQCGSFSKEGDCYNREHSVPKSWFSENTPAYSDLVHLVPTDGKINGMRSNYAFGEVSSATYSYTIPERSYGGTIYQKAGSSKLGSPKTITYNNSTYSTSESKVFEPDDQFKGDFARIYFYFAVRYGGTTCAATGGSGAAMFSSSSPYLTNYGKALMCKWHEQDPVSEKEITRNDAIESHQGNRNPFVDYPEWADKIWGSNYSSNVGTLSSLTVTADDEDTTSGISVDVGSYKTIKVIANYDDGSTKDVSSLATFSTTANNNDYSSYYKMDGTKLVGLTETSYATINISYGGKSTVRSIYVTAAGTGNGTTYETSGGSGESGGSGDSGGGTVTSEGTATYTIASTTKVNTSGTAPTGSSATFSNTYGTATQLTSGNTATLTLSGYSGKIIKSITLSMKSNSSKGAGYLSAKAGTTTLASIGSSSSGVNFNNASWNGAWSTSYVDIKPTISNSSYTIGAGENVVIEIGATVNSLYIQSYTIGYSSGSSSSTVAVTGVTLTPSTLNLDLNGTKTSTLTATVAPTNATNKNVTWSSSNETVATVSNGVVTAVAAGTASITVKTNDGGYTATCEVTVTNTGGETTTSSSPYYNGVPYKFQLPKADPYYFTGTMTGYYGATSTTLSKGVDTYFEANGDGQNIYFYDSSNAKQYISIALPGTHINFVFNTTVPKSPWLYDSTNKYLYYTIESTNYVMGLNGTYTTISATTAEKAASTTFYHATFKLTDVGFAKLFLSAFNCDSTGTTAPTFNISWDKLSSEYSSLLADYQTSIKGATGNQTGTDIEKAVARYDYVVAKYGYNNFINRSILSANQINILNNKGNNLVILTVILSAASVVSLCSLFVFKKKKD